MGFSRLPSMPVLLLLLLLVSLHSYHPTHAFPTGAGSCNVGSAAVGGSHLSSNSITTGPANGDRGLRFLVDGQALVVGTPRTLALNPPVSDDDGLTEQIHTLTLESLVPTSNFRGYSIIASPAENTVLYDLQWEITDSTTQKVNALCTAGTVAGITHTDAELKSSVVWELTAVVTQDAVVDETVTVPIPLDVTVVLQNSDGISQYYYSQYMMQFVLEPRDDTETPATAWDVIAERDDMVVFAETVAQVPEALALLESTTDTLTVFGANDAAFDATDDDARLLRILTDAAFEEHLQDLMLYQIHTLAAFTNQALLTRATAEQPLPMANTGGEALPLFLGTSGGTSFVELQTQGAGATLMTAVDLSSTNSIVHVIDKLLLPSSVTNDMMADLEEDTSVGTFLSLLQAAGLDGVLTGADPITVFAPTDAAFANMDPVELEFLGQPENADLLRDILTYHIANGVFTESDLPDTPTITMQNSKTVDFDPIGGRLTSTSGNEAELASIDTLANNGVLHTITEVLIPEAIVIPTFAPTKVPTVTPTTGAPTNDDSTKAPTLVPTISATTIAPTLVPTTAMPSELPSVLPSISTEAPSGLPTVSAAPSGAGPTTLRPSASPSVVPSIAPTNATDAPSTGTPSEVPSIAPSLSIAPTPTMPFTQAPSTVAPTIAPSTSAPTNATRAPSTRAPTTLQPTNGTASRPPTVSPTLPSSLVRVNTTFVLFNTEGLEARDVTSPTYIDTLNEAYSDFVSGVVLAQLRGSRFLRQQQRRLDVALETGSPEIFAARDVVCPSASSDGSSIPGSANCQDVFGRYSLSVTSDENPTVVRQQYTNATDQAVTDGDLQDALDAVDSNSPFTVAGLPPTDDKDDSDGGLAGWLVAVIVLCSALGAAILGFLIYLLMKPKDEESPEDEYKEPFIVAEMEVPPPPEDDPPLEPSTIDPVEDEVWEDEEEENWEDETLKSIPEMTVVDIQEDDVEEEPGEVEKDQAADVEEEWKDEDTDPDEGWDDENAEDPLLLENGEPELAPVVEDEGFALEDIDDEEISDSAGEEKEDPPESAHEGDAPGLRESQLGQPPDLTVGATEGEVISRKEEKSAGVGDTQGTQEQDTTAFDIEQADNDDEEEEPDETDGNDDGNQDSFRSSTTGDDQFWQVPDISVQDENDVEDILRKSIGGGE